MTTFGSSFIHSNAVEFRKIKLCESLLHVERENTPDTVVSHPCDFCDFGNRHFPAKDEQNLLKQQSEATSLPCPGDVDPVNAVLAALNPRHIGSNGAFVLKEIEMLPARFLEVVSFTQCPANRARIFRSSAGRQLELQFGRIALKVKLGRNFLPRQVHQSPRTSAWRKSNIEKLAAQISNPEGDKA